MAAPKRTASKYDKPRTPECFFGLESELSLHAHHRGNPLATISDLDKVLVELISHAGEGVGAWVTGEGRACWLPNGGLVYIDSGDHPEYATPETSDPIELVRQHRLGEELLAQAAAELNRFDERVAGTGLRPFDPPLERTVFKSTVDTQAHSFGFHENYLTSARFDAEKQAPLLGSFLASRVVFSGLGGIQEGRDGVRYVISPRARHITRLSSNETLDKRGLVNLRNEHHADVRTHRRLHLIVGEANRLDRAIWLKVATTAIVVSMIDRYADKRGHLPLGDLIFERPVRALHGAARLEGLGERFRTRNGRYLTPLDHQRLFVEHAARYVERFGERLFAQPETAAEVIEQWQSTLDDLAIDPMRTVGDLDWTTKLFWLKRFAQRHGIDETNLRHPELQQFDIAWGAIGEQSIVGSLERKGKATRLAGPTGPEHLTAPRDSRAAFRSLCVTRHRDAIADMSWDSVEIRSGVDGVSLLYTMDAPGTHDQRAVQSSGLDTKDSDQFRAHVALQEIRRHRSFELDAIEPDLADALLSCAEHAEPDDRMTIAQAVANGTHNGLRQLIRNGYAYSSSETSGTAWKLDDTKVLYEAFTRAADLSGCRPSLERDLVDMVVEEAARLEGEPAEGTRNQSRRDVLAVLERIMDVDDVFLAHEPQVLSRELPE